MPIPVKYLAKFEENKYYHVYNQTVHNRRLFTYPENYRYFLRKFDEYLSGFVEVDAWCLLGNHFHFLIRIKTVEELGEEEKTKLSKYDSINDCLVLQFKNFFIAYSRAYAKQENIESNLFRPKFKRIWVDNENYYTRLVYYIHANPQIHGIVKDFREYEWSSYQRILLPQATKLCKEKVLEWFGGSERYVSFHSEAKVTYVGMKDYLLDE